MALQRSPHQVVIDDPQDPKVHASAVVVVCKREVEATLQPPCWFGYMQAVCRQRMGAAVCSISYRMAQHLAELPAIATVEYNKQMLQRVADSKHVAIAAMVVAACLCNTHCATQDGLGSGSWPTRQPLPVGPSSGWCLCVRVDGWTKENTERSKQGQ